jgi:AhpD family alkylhydroperoxidase
MLDEKIKELIAIGASVSANCHPCIRYHTAKAREMKIDEAEIRQAIEVGKMVRKGAAGQMDKLLEEISK